MKTKSFLGYQRIQGVRHIYSSFDNKYFWQQIACFAELVNELLVN